MTWVAAGVGAASVAGSVGGGMLSKGDSKKAAKKQKIAGFQAINELKRAKLANEERIEPIRAGGMSGFDEYLNRLGVGGEEGVTQDENYGQLLRQFQGEDVKTDPGYQFGLQQGEQGINNRLAGSGNYLSGAGLKEINRFNQDYAGTKFNEAYNRDALDKGRIHDYLQGISNIGIGSTNYLNQQETGTAQGVGNLLLGIGNADAAGIIGAGNARNDMIGSVTDILQSYAGGLNLGGGSPGGDAGSFFGNTAAQQNGNLLAGPGKFGGGFAPGSLDPDFFKWS